MTDPQEYQLHAYIFGQVQGVGFRYHTLNAAQNLNLTGWVRNLRDGRVEVLAEGSLDDLNQLLSVLRKGPMSAEVYEVEYEFGDAEGNFSRFQSRMTA